MNLRTLGKTGFKVSEIGLGCWQLGGDFGPVSDDQAQQILSQAHENQINFWDTADVYGAGRSEQIIAKWRKQHSDAKNLVVATKVGRTGELFPDKYTKESVKSAIQTNAKSLDVDCIDLIQLHCIPPEVLKDGEIFTWLQDFKKQGLIKHYGASVETIEEGLLCMQDPELASLQIIFNIFRQDAISELLPKAAENNVGVIVRLPLASGLLSGKYKVDQKFDDTDHRNYNKDGAAFSVGETFSGIPMNKGIELVKELEGFLPKNITMAQLALRWILDQPAISSVIAGVSKPTQIALNTSASNLAPLPTELHEQLKTFYFEAVKQNVRGNI
ncbi:aldo/keto reductase [Paraglaciecola aquimarina]|uniref:Aldo/keto reductase n=1 Tax=Paraglaciecola algarum TaxID=3050085 RepID=A0ABS9DAR5_9ALTE|nr:aldo/keto reductase [Paraglaciecola sp. G1-23]MCF2950008.1 aldo/keto reductase [Paraglaciecola sp. G1-23]